MGLSLHPPWGAAGHRGQPARRNLPAGSKPPPADDIQSEELAHASRSSTDAVPFVRWYHMHNKWAEGGDRCQKGEHEQ